MYMVQSFIAGKRGQLQPDSPIQANSTVHARAVAKRLALRKALVVAFQREGDPKTGEWENAKLIDASAKCRTR
ncbi:hypothetical protein FKO01_25305 [Mesorhizobium sp. B2-3-3]|nr:hypothetical protein FKO01_25305 [Mesorhizobium sp. B2-3-3]